MGSERHLYTGPPFIDDLRGFVPSAFGKGSHTPFVVTQW